jgi:ABC-2 type transport system permease protein
MREALALAVKDLRLLVRDRAGFFFTFFFPLIIAIFFGAIFGGGDENYQVSVNLVDEDQSAGSRAFIDSLAAVPVLKLRQTSRDSAETSVRLGRSTAYILVKPGFGEAQERVFWGQPPAVEVGMDPARRADAAMLEGVLMKVASQRFQRAFNDRRAQRENLDRAKTSLGASASASPAVRRSLEKLFDGLGQFYAEMPESAGPGDQGGRGSFGAMEPLSIATVAVGVSRHGPKNAYAITFPQGVIWGFIGVTAAFGLSIVTERTGGTLMRLQVSPIGRAHILAGKALATFLTTVTLSVGLYALGYAVFGVRPDSLPLLAAAVVSSAICFVGIMMLLSVLGKTEQAASGIGWAVLLIFSMLGGGMIPYFIMPSWMRALSNASPVKWSILAMEGAVWRRFSLAEMLLPCAVLVGVGAAFFAIGVRVFAWTSDK